MGYRARQIVRLSFVSLVSVLLTVRYCNHRETQATKLSGYGAGSALLSSSIEAKRAPKLAVTPVPGKMPVRAPAPASTPAHAAIPYPECSSAQRRKCEACTAGNPADGGVPPQRGHCVGYCSVHGYCGKGPNYNIPSATPCFKCFAPTNQQPVSPSPVPVAAIYQLRNTSVAVKEGAFNDRLDAALRGADTPMKPSDIAAVEDKILTFHIPKPVTLYLKSDYIPLFYRRWMDTHKAQCPNCRITLKAEEHAPIKLDMSCSGAPTRDFPGQVLICGCGESHDSSRGKPYFFGNGKQPAGRSRCDYDASFDRPDSAPNFHVSYSHLHFTPPKLAPNGVEVNSVTDEAKRLVNRTRIHPYEKAPSVFIHSACNTQYARTTLVQGMISKDDGSVDRWGKCFRNRDISKIEPKRENWYWHDSQGNRDTTKTDALARYPFSFALENHESENYFTEKRFEAFAAGSVPIVWKNHNSIRYLPGGASSAVFPEDFNRDPAKLIAYLKSASPLTNPKAYEKYMAWKSKGIERDYVRLMFQSEDFLACRICEQFSEHLHAADEQTEAQSPLASPYPPVTPSLPKSSSAPAMTLTSPPALSGNNSSLTTSFTHDNAVQTTCGYPAHASLLSGFLLKTHEDNPAQCTSGSVLQWLQMKRACGILSPATNDISLLFDATFLSWKNSTLSQCTTALCSQPPACFQRIKQFAKYYESCNPAFNYNRQLARASAWSHVVDDVCSKNSAAKHQTVDTHRRPHDVSTLPIPNTTKGTLAASHAPNAVSPSLSTHVVASSSTQQKIPSGSNVVSRKRNTSVAVKEGAFNDRLDAALRGADTPMKPSDIAAVEDKILTFHIPKPVTLYLKSDYIPLFYRRWMDTHKAQCPNCRITLKAEEHAPIKLDMSCSGAPTRDFPEQVLICGCGESHDSGRGRPYFVGGGAVPAGRSRCDYDASFDRPDSAPNFHVSYSHLHFTPPKLAPNGVEVNSVTDEAKRLVNRTRIHPYEKAPSVFIHSACNTQYARTTLVQGMISKDDGSVDRWGQCFRNRDISKIEPKRENWYWHDSQGNRDTTKTDALARYPFSFALENHESENYFTEKRFEAFAAGSVPIVWKNHNSIRYLPGGASSAVFPEDFNRDPAKLIAYLKSASPLTNPKAYEKYMAWKSKGIERDYVRLMFQSEDFLACRICEQFSEHINLSKPV